MCFSSVFNIFRGGNPSGNISSPRDCPLNIEPSLEPGIYLSTVQNTNSMEPLIDVGHTMILSALPEHLAAVKVGSVVVWQLTGSPNSTIHSIIDKTDDNLAFRTQGLNVNRPDQWISRDNIKAVALGVLWTPQRDGFVPVEGD